mgnify:CR=1 FL=1|tara:strand:- start:2998 stop:3648 length:651 start_codon:yes stop_codon:yes gene_type:complete
MNEFKIRCSAINNIMAKPTGKRIISAGAQTYCDKWLKEQIFERKELINSKYITKGEEVELLSIDFISNKLYKEPLIKNDEYFSNDYFTGTPDVITENEIIEIKNSWNCFTFPLLEKELTNKSYYYQVQGYMYLTGLKKSKVIYTLMDTPEHIIEDEYNKSTVDDYELFREKYIFSNIEDKYRMKVFEVDYDKSVIDLIKQRVDSCRVYLNEIKSKL